MTSILTLISDSKGGACSFIEDLPKNYLVVLFAIALAYEVVLWVIGSVRIYQIGVVGLKLEHFLVCLILYPIHLVQGGQSRLAWIIFRDSEFYTK